MKKRLMVILTAFMVLMLGGCEGKETTSENTTAGDETAENVLKDSENRKEKENTTPTEENNDVLDGILKDITEDFDNTIDYLTSELDNVYEKVGNSYESYIDNKEAITEWYDLAQTESEKLYKITAEKSESYYKMITTSVEHDDYDAIEEELDNYYECVYEDLYDEMYESIYEDAFDELYDRYYDGILEEADDSIDYGEWLDVSSDCYSEWLDAHSEFYGEWLDSHSEIYSIWLDVESAFLYNEDFDVDSILKEQDKNDSESGEVETEIKSNTQTEENDGAELETNNSGIRPEFKEAMDSYEAFFDEYIEFMQKYAQTEDSISMLGDYAKYIEQYAETMEKLDAIGEEELSDEEAVYYAEVSARISQKLLSVDM